MKTIETTTLKLADLIEDTDLYPRNSVDATHVSHLLRAIYSGAALPPPIIDQRTKLIIDGVHRVRAWRRHLGPRGEIDCVVRRFKGKPEMLLASVEANSEHGLKLSHHDRIRVALLADKHGVASSKIAVVLHITERAVEKLRVRIVTDGGTREPVPIKKGGKWLEGRTLTSEQVTGGLKPVRSLEASRCARELLRMMKFELIDWDDEDTVKSLKELRTVLGRELRGR